ncbi:hypothetical protein B484DRAFT_456773, partial [Ochromonadaceae sp. CCMP2298]
MAERREPSSATNDLLSYLMYYNAVQRPSTATDSLIRELMERDVSAEVQRRYDDFYSRSSGITLYMEEQWSKTFLKEYVLGSIEAMGTAWKAEAASKGFSEQRWANMMHEIIFQIGLAELREAFDLSFEALPSTSADIQIPHSLNPASLKKVLREHMKKYEEHYMEWGGTGAARFQEHLETLCGRPFEKQENTGNTRKGAKKATKKDVFSLASVYDLLDEHPVGDFLHRVVSFINRVEDAVLPIPVALRATYSGVGSSAGAGAGAGRRTLSQMRQADWTDEEAEQQGPYQASRARSSDRGSTSTSRQSISPLLSERNERGANGVVQSFGRKYDQRDPIRQVVRSASSREAVLRKAEAARSPARSSASHSSPRSGSKRSLPTREGQGHQAAKRGKVAEESELEESEREEEEEEEEEDDGAADNYADEGTSEDDDERDERGGRRGLRALVNMEKTKKQAMKFPSTLSSPAKSHGRGLGKAKGGKGGIAQR